MLRVRGLLMGHATTAIRIVVIVDMKITKINENRDNRIT